MTSADKPALKEPQMLQTIIAKLKPYLVPTLIFLTAAGILVAIIGNWNSWASERAEQETDDAYVRADLTPLSTKVSGVVVKVLVDDYQTVKAGDLLVQLRDDDFRAQVAQAEAAVEAAKAAIEDNRRQKDLQDAKTDRAKTGIDLAKAQISAAQAAIEATKADVDRTLAERARQEALIATQSATQQHGGVGERKARRGQLVSPGTQVLSLVQTDAWVQAN